MTAIMAMPAARVTKREGSSVLVFYKIAANCDKLMRESERNIL